MADERILGGGAFVEEVLGRCEAGEERQKAIFRDIDDVMERVGKYYGVEKEEIVETRTKRVREARNVLLFIGVKYLKKSVTEAGKILKISQCAASIAMKKGMKIESNKRLVKKLAELNLNT